MTEDKRMVESFKEKIEADYKELKSFFEKGDFQAMVHLLGEHAILSSPEGERIQGMEGLLDFWKRARMTASTVSFRLICPYVRRVSKVIPQPDPENNILHVGHEITAFRLLSESSNSTGTWTRALLHPQRCVWSP